MSLQEAPRLQISAATSLKGHIAPPSSKSTSTRSVLAATMAKGRSEILNIANSANVKAMIRGCEHLGAQFTFETNGKLLVDGPGFDRFNDETTIDAGNSGIVLRLLLGATAKLTNVCFVTKYEESLGSRSNLEMMEALQQLGVQCQWKDIDGKLPICLDGSDIHGGDITISARKSSQFLSGLLFLAGGLEEPVRITVSDELKAPDMVRTTIAVMQRSGIAVMASDDLMSFEIKPGTVFHPTTHVIGCDPASTAALLAVCSVVPSDVRLVSYREEELGNGAVINHLRNMGVQIEQSNDELHIKGGGNLKALDFDGSLAPDAVLPLAAVSAFAEGTSRFTNIEHLRFKECDRISDYRAELEKMGVSTEENHDELIIHGSPNGVEGGAIIDGHFDHGVIMALTAVGLASKQGVIIDDPCHVAQTYPDFFDDLASIGGGVTTVVAAA